MRCSWDWRISRRSCAHSSSAWAQLPSSCLHLDHPSCAAAAKHLAALRVPALPGCCLLPQHTPQTQLETGTPPPPPRGACPARRQYAALEAEGAQVRALDSQRSARQAAKAAGVRSQRALWERLLELRILLQKPVTAAVRLPLGGAQAAASRAHADVAAG